MDEEGASTPSITSVLVAGYLKDTLQAQLAGVISSPQFPPQCVVDERGRPVHAIRLYTTNNKVVEGDEVSNIIICVSEFKLPSAELMAAVAQMLLYIAKQYKTRLVLSIDSIPLDEKEKDEDAPTTSSPLTFVTTSTHLRQALESKQHIMLKDSLVSGLPALLLAEAALESVAVGYVVGAARADIPDASAAVELVRFIDFYCKGVEIDVTPLETKSKRLAESIDELLKQQASHGDQGGFGRSSQSSTMYS